MGTIHRSSHIVTGNVGHGLGVVGSGGEHRKAQDDIPHYGGTVLHQISIRDCTKSWFHAASRVARSATSCTHHQPQASAREHIDCGGTVG